MIGFVFREYFPSDEPNAMSPSINADMID